MPNLAHRMITDLLDDNLEMLHNGDIAPRRISIFHSKEANPQVRDGVTRLEEKMIEVLDPDDVYIEARRWQKRLYIPALDNPPIMLTPSTLIIVLHYSGANPRFIELNLDDKGAKLHFHRK